MSLIRLYRLLPLAFLITAILSQGAFADLIALPDPTPAPMPVPTVEPTPAPMPGPEALPGDSQLFSSSIKYIGAGVVAVVSMAFFAITKIKGKNK